MEKINVKGLMCHGCEKRLETAIKNLGIENVKANYETGTLEYENNMNVSIEQIKEAIKDTGFDF